MSDSKTWTAKKVRQTFVDFMKAKGHTHWPSSAVVPYNDPTLLFTNAGMNQFKAIFLGQADPKTDLGKLKRAANSQKCIRAGGKHNDLEDVGKDVYHHTFFEMLGNWSFGDYFKEEAIDFAWELLTEVYKIDKSRLYATYFGGKKEQGLEPDLEAKKIWLKYLPEERVLPFGMKDNFWEMGATGPCGPCTEIHYDRIGNRFVPERVNADHPDLVEIWNLVFIQYNREPDSSLRSLPAKSVDTGMGFERLTSVLQDVDSNYDTDIFKGIFAAIQKECGCPEYKRRVGKDDPEFIDMAYRVVADHIRTLTFAITDGAAPGANGRDYVLRRVCRRAVRYGKEKLGAPPLFFNKLVPAVVEGFGEAFPELKKDPKRVQNIILEEEKVFTKTLDKGINFFKKATANLKAGDTLSGQKCANLLTTYGFPEDLTELMAEERGLKVDMEGFKVAMEDHKDRSKGGSGSGNASLRLQAEQVAIIKSKGIALTDDSHKYNWNSTGSGPKCDGTVKAIYLGKADFVERIQRGEKCGLILDNTSFYAEQGGQIYDIGEIKTATGTLRVEDCQVAAGYVLHVGTVKSGSISVGSKCESYVNYGRRALVAKNHTATHLLNYALRDVLKKEVDQKGSLVQAERLRFDFSADRGLKVDEISKVEEVVCKQIDQKYEVFRRPTQIADAKKINGLRAVFGEKYPDPVTVVSVGADVNEILKEPGNEKWQSYSIEFCGGTHVKNIDEIKKFVVIEENSIAAGTRRVVGYTGKNAKTSLEVGMKMEQEAKEFVQLNNLEAIGIAITTIDSKLKNAEADSGVQIPYTVKSRILSYREKLLNSKKKLFKQGDSAAKEASVELAKSLAQEAAEKGAKFVITKLDAGANVSTMNAAIVEFQRIAPGACFLCLSEVKAGGKMAGIAVVPKEFTTKLPANKWLLETLKQCGGKGGGKPNRAQGASKDSTNIDKAVEFGEQMAQGALD
eukprot:CAMPEP_0184483716 /NCGR_PEP_ID=MMETSP0113_2-20130426/5386_1 /TAXON_ID=91329 /ORGANISM="Norrisiella sphaerica, Strain BC52" /LENGTH=960 /DNA_ID=CAMNT_0026864283 /DNA_START=84 /DNA_END=2966 /DNA_ORIENTATION=+